MSLEINDPVYGNHVFNEPILIELINSAPIQRLKGVCQFGMPDPWNLKPNYSRFDHGLGVAVLLAKLNASLEEQVAGLLHDAGHTVFSHVIDYVLGDSIKQDINDQLYEKIITNGQVSDILNKYALMNENIKNIKNYPLLKREVPHLCADTIDYCLRELIIDNKTDLAKKLFNDLIVFDNKIIFSSKESAKAFANEFLRMNNTHWIAPLEKTKYMILANILKRALATGIITKKDFLLQDKDILDKLKASKIPEIQQGLEKLASGKIKTIPVTAKFRYSDPDFLENGQLKSLSEIDQEFREKTQNLKMSQ